MSRQLCFLYLCCDRRNNYCGTKPIPNVVLNDEYRAHPALFRSNNWGKVCKINVSTFDNQRIILRLLDVQLCALPHILLEMLQMQSSNLFWPFPYSPVSWIHEYVSFSVHANTFLLLDK